ncbi:MAG: hypothetical protein Fur002_21970 [Anaerolineales bacterium]
MGKHVRQVREAPIEKDYTKSLAWRALGLALMLLTPAISILAAIVTLDTPLAYYLPYELFGYPNLPPVLFSTDGLATIFSPIANTENLYAIIFVSVIYMILLGGIVSLIYAIVYRVVNPRKYGPFDAPPPKHKAKKYTR